MGVVLVLVVLAAAVVGVVRRPLPQTDGEVTVPGLTASVEVLRDDHDIPQLYADTDADLFRAQGYVHAQERFFEMDFRRHVTAGRLSEIFGEDTLETDKFIRTMDWRGVAEQEWALLQPATRDALTAYAEGVNAYLAERKPSELAAEYAVLGLSGLDYTPEEWEPVDSLAWLKAMAWDLRGNMDAEVDRVQLSVDHTADEIAALWPDVPATTSTRRSSPAAASWTASSSRTPPPTAPATRAGRRTRRRSSRRSSACRTRSPRCPTCSARGAASAATRGSSTASTARPGCRCWPTTRTSASASPASGCRWACTAASSPPSAPSTRSGFTFSGVPGVIIGHNADIAWGFTNLGPDVTDLFLEQTEGDDRYVRDGESVRDAGPHRDDRGAAARTTSSCACARPSTGR